MTRTLALLALLMLAACGADGAPDTPEPGIRISGEAQIGISTGDASRTP
jgi:hypothetical protein